jgi:hypothetical protein
MDPARKRQRPATRHLLGGLVFNPNGDPLAGADLSRDKRNRPPFYATRAGAKPSITINAADLEKAVADAVLAAFDKTALPEPVTENVTGSGEIAALEAEMAELAELRGDGTITLPEWLAARKPLQERIDAARRAAGTRRRQPASAGLLTEAGALRRAWPTLDLARRREILALVIEKITVGPATRARWTTVDERVAITWRV